MPFSYIDPEVGAGMAAIFGSGPPPDKSAKGDYEARRQMVSSIFSQLFPAVPSSVSMEDHYVDGEDGHKILLRWYKKSGTQANSPAVVYYHGGGLIAGDVTMYNGGIARYVDNTGVPFLGVEFRPAPEAQYPINVKDAYAGLKWMFQNAGKLGVDPARIAVMGDSGGGAMATSITHWNLEHEKLPIVKQILIYPMLDDRNTIEDKDIGAFAVWNEIDNHTGWQCHLGDLFQTDKVPPSAAAARMTKADGLPPAYIEVGELDIFRDEDIAYAAKLGQAGISCEFHLHPGCPHAFEVFAAESTVAKRAFADRYRAISSF